MLFFKNGYSIPGPVFISKTYLFMNSKIKKEAGHAAPVVRLVENPDILAELAHHQKRPRLVVGFAAETDDVLSHAAAKRLRKGADWIVANDVSTNGKGETVMGGERNQVHLITATKQESWPEMAKADVARRLVQHITQHFQDTAS